MIPKAISVVMWPGTQPGLEYVIVYLRDFRNVRTPGRTPRITILARGEPEKGGRILSITTAADSGEPHTIERPVHAEARVA